MDDSAGNSAVATRSGERRQRHARPRDLWHWYGWTGSAPLWLGALLLALLPFFQVLLVPQVAIVSTLTALGGLVRQLVHGDYGHAGLHLTAALLGATTMVLGFWVV
ncbi:hypothetical protein [Streptomyces sp. NRRL S-87]|uniref:hypothetical protein n=1 Tax=Streptomyces sp. NRRL S-87 TaxID=1463920 RepID=UPI000B193DA3|nr:hypothetical protein [Streptomyces sp. NRRL S-87]